MLGRSAHEIVDAVKSGKRTALSIVEEILEYCDKEEVKSLNIFINLDRDKIIASAKEVDRKMSCGEKLGPLAGVPVVIKDNISVKGEKLTCASKMLENYEATFDATVIKKLKEADAIPFGRANLDEFAMGSSTEYSAFGATKNPWDKERVPGGSSGGSAAAVAALIAPIALGSETGGSVRQPSSFCGLVGIKPTYGRVSRYGLVSFASSLDQVGIFGRDAKDVALALKVISGFDPKDSTTSPVEVKDYTNMDSIKGLKIALINVSNLEKEVAEGLKESKKRLEKLGCIVEEISVEDMEKGIDAYYIIAPAEVSSNLARLDGIKYGPKIGKDNLDNIYTSARDNFGDEVKRRIMIGNYVLSSGHYSSLFEKGYRVRRIVEEEFTKFFESYDAVLTPTTLTRAFKFGENSDNPVKMYLSDLLTVSANLAGIPGVSFPVNRNGLPVGMQLLTKKFNEDIILNIVDAFEKDRGEVEFRRLDV